MYGAVQHSVNTYAVTAAVRYATRYEAMRVQLCDSRICCFKIPEKDKPVEEAGTEIKPRIITLETPECHWTEEPSFGIYRGPMLTQTSNRPSRYSLSYVNECSSSENGILEASLVFVYPSRTAKSKPYPGASIRITRIM